mgnify:CR=1 FL=1
MAWCPHDDWRLAVADDAGTVSVYSVPDGGVEEDLTTPTKTYQGAHGKRCGGGGGVLHYMIICINHTYCMVLTYQLGPCAIFHA